MKRLVVATVAKLDYFLATNTLHANGKNFTIDHLHATSADSRWTYENIFGIYLTKPEYAWMALWMSVTDRTKLRKRQLRYIVPTHPDHIGRLEIYDQHAQIPRSLLVDQAFVYIFDIASISHWLTLTSRDESSLTAAGFSKKQLTKNGKTIYPWYFKNHQPLCVAVDAWQIAVVNQTKIFPLQEVVIAKRCVDELTQRVKITRQPVTEDYIVSH